MGPVEDVHATRLLESLPARPPTPPREILYHDLDALPKQLTVNLRHLQTPPGFLSPSSSSKDSTTRRKRVGFLAQAQYQEPPIYIDPSSKVQQATPVSRPSSSLRPVKGILKPAATSNRLGPILGEDLDNLEKPGQAKFAEMLESTLQQLAGMDRESRIDAYIMLFRGLKASSNLPDRIALQQKLGLFLQFIQRDLSIKTSSGIVDTVLVTSATKLLHTFMRHQGIASSITSEFGIFLVDHCVRSFQEGQAPKEVVRHLMHSLCLQNFSAEVMTAERVGRLVNALHDLEGHMTGKSIIQSRVHVYEKLVKQCPQQMAFHSDWLQDLFTDMLSSTAEIRTAAIRLGLQAAFSLNEDKRVVTRTLELLNLVLDERKYVEHITERLRSMLEVTEDCVFVPRIWSVITLFVPKPGDWDYFKPWATTLQSCFNHANTQVRKEANQAWSRYTYRLFLDGSLGTRKIIKHVLTTPLLQLKSKRKGLHDSNLGCVRNFLYYACRPGMDQKTLADIWDVGIAPLTQQLVDHAQDGNSNITEALAILIGLVDCETRRVWHQKRIADQALIKDEELPAVEPKWIRGNSVRVLELVRLLLAKQFADLSIPASQTQKLWRALVASVASASSKDVKLHDDTAKFVASAFTFLLAIWKNGPASAMGGKPCSSSQFLNSVRDFILILVQGLGLLPNPFMDKQLVQSKDDRFIPHTASSSHRSAKFQSTKRTPLDHLFLMLSRLPPGVDDDDALAQFIDSTFHPFFDEKSEKAQADLARDLLRLLPMDIYCPYGPWTLCATKLSVSLEGSQDTDLSGSGGNVGPRYREIVKVLERGVRSTQNLPWEQWLSCFSSLLTCVRSETGVAGVALAVVEPLAAVLNDLIASKPGAMSASCVRATIELVRSSNHPHNKLAVDAARRRLWGTSNAGARQASFDPYDNLYKLLVRSMQMMYTEQASYDSESSTLLLIELGRFLERGNPQLVLRALTTIQDSVALWVEDKDHRVTRTGFPGLVEAITSLWLTFCRILAQVPAARLQLEVMEPLFCAAFRSTHRDIVSAAVETWNQIYEHVDHIEYPETLKNVLESLGSSVDVFGPGLKIIDDNSNMRPHFTESQDFANHLPFISPAKYQSTPVPHSSASRRSQMPGLAKTAEKHLSRPDSVSSAGRRAKGRTPKTKLRHEDSQVQFAAITASSPPTAFESQLTDRQKEIRERQRETAAMFPPVHSSPTEKTKKAQPSNAQQHIAPSASYRAATPEHDGGFDDCMTSTPTPRRGQSAPLQVHDHEMIDPPSSPPEPRSSRLLAELKSQTSRAIPVDDWHFSSSPISGSPNPVNQTSSASQAMELDVVDEQLQINGDNPADTDAIVDSIQRDAVSSQLPIVDEAALHGQGDDDTDLSAVKSAEANQQLHTTPARRNLRSSGVQLTPRSENEEFMDARSSPMPPTPSQRFATAATHPAKLPLNVQSNESFNVSASFENGLRAVSNAYIDIPLRSSQPRGEYAAYEDILPESPEHIEAHLESQKNQPEEVVEVLGTIEVAGAEDRKPKRGRPKKGRTGSVSQNLPPSRPSSMITRNSQGIQTHIPSTPIEELVSSRGNFDNVSPGNGRWWRKRKRSFSSSVLSSGGSKKSRYEDFLAAESIPEETSDSQRVPGAAAVHDDPPARVQTAEELYQAEVSSQALEEDSLAEHTMPSQELPFADEDGNEPTQESQPSPPAIADEKDIQEPPLELEHQSEPEPEVDADVDVPQDHTDYMDEDMNNFTDDEEAVHSQLAREEEESASRAASPSRALSVPVEQGIAQLDEHQEDATSLREAPQQEVAMVETASQEPVGKFQGLMGLFRSGLDMLRTTDLTREQVYEVEDLMFETRRELLHAEKRGRP